MSMELHLEYLDSQDGTVLDKIFLSLKTLYEALLNVWTQRLRYEGTIKY